MISLLLVILHIVILLMTLYIVIDVWLDWLGGDRYFGKLLTPIFFTLIYVVVLIVTIVIFGGV